MKKKIMSLLMSVIVVASMLAGCGSEAGGGARKGDTMTVSEMFDALVEDNGGEAMIFSTTANKLSADANVGVSVYDGETKNVCKEHETIGEIMTGQFGVDDLGGIVHEEEATLYLVTDEAENVLYEKMTSYGFKFDGTNLSRIDIDGTTFIVITTPRPTDNLNPNGHVLFPETESMVGKTIVMDTVGAEGVGVNLED